jgi:RNA polymerase sigma-70 factor (ECF subfamily)
MAIDAVTGVAAPTARSHTALLVERAQAGDRVAFEALIEDRVWRLLRLASSILLHDADARDAVQESCLRAWVELPKLRDRDQFEAWLWRIVINACRSSLRRRGRVSIREIAIDEDADGRQFSDPTPGIAEAASEIDVIRRAFRRLDPDRRTILILHHVEERSVANIADLLAIPEGTAKWRLYAARRALARALEVERR